MITVEDLKREMQVRIDDINTRHAHPCSKRFRENCYEKWACKEVLREIELSEGLPFVCTASDILHDLKRRMDSAPGHITCFSIGADVIDELIDKFESGDPK